MYIPVPVREYLRKNQPDVLRMMEQDPNLHPVLDSLLFAQNDDLANNLSLIGMIHNNAPGAQEQIPRATSFVSSVLARGLQLRNLADANVPRRPTEEGLPMALLIMAEHRERFRNTKLASLNMDPAAMRAKVAHINAIRGAVSPTISLLRGMMRNLAYVESAAMIEMRDDYELCRAQAKADLDLAALDTVDHYLYGPAEKAADTRRGNRRTFEDLTAKAEKEALASATRKARSSITQEFEGLLQDLRRTEPASEENRKDPR